MTPDQKATDFQQLAAVYAINYGPAQWKRDALHVDLLDIGTWLKEAAATPDDLSFYELCVQYVASLKDAHSGFYVPSSYTVSLPFLADIYDGKVRVDSLDPALGGENYPVGLGDEILAMDEVDVATLLDQLSAYASTGNAESTRRIAAAYLSTRPQQLMPKVANLGDQVSIKVRHATGIEETITLDWLKAGQPLTVIGPVISPYTSPPANTPSAVRPPKAAVADYMAPLLKLRDMRLPPAKFIRGFGETHPPFYLPPDFSQRMGSPGDVFYSGTYLRDGVRIGFIRIPSFEAFYATYIFQAEIAYMQENTDGLVLDVTRNPGGDGCYAQDLLSLVIPTEFRTIGLEIRATRNWVTSFEDALALARNSGAPKEVVQEYESIVNEVEKAYMTPSGRTAPLPICGPSLNTQPYTDDTGAVVAYTKPVILLIDAFSASAADMFAAAFQDAARGPVVGSRTMGAGGNVEDFANVTTYSTGEATITESLMVRKAPIQSEYGPTAYIENVGVRPDKTLELMTEDNRENGGQAFVEAFTNLIEDEVRANPPVPVPVQSSTRTAPPPGRSGGVYLRVPPLD